MMNQFANAETADSAYKSLYKLGGAAALIVAVLTLGEVIGLTFYPQPCTVSDWFMLFQSNPFSRLTAYVGILAYALSLADYLRQALTTSAIVALLVILPNALFLVIWFILVGRRIYQLGRLDRKELPQQS